MLHVLRIVSAPSNSPDALQFLLLCMAVTYYQSHALLPFPYMMRTAHHLTYIMYLHRHQELRESAVRGIAGPGKIVTFRVLNS